MDIHPQTTIGEVALTVADLERSLAFYRQNIGLQLQQRQSDTAVLGVGETDLLRLVERPGAPRQPRTTGLYHFALRVPSRVELARTLQHLATTQTPLQGFSDHSVSEAIYLADPEGNGIEIYRDREREEWPFVNGRLQMDTKPLDIDDLMASLNGERQAFAGLHRDTVMGHIHLHVNRLEQAESFYADGLGFGRMMRYGPSAAFVSAGGYHHHIGMNTWAGVNIPAPAKDTQGLRWYTIQLPTAAALTAVLAQLDEKAITYERQEEAIILRDPAGNGIRIVVKSDSERN